MRTANKPNKEINKLKQILIFFLTFSAFMSGFLIVYFGPQGDMIILLTGIIWAIVTIINGFCINKLFKILESNMKKVVPS